MIVVNTETVPGREITNLKGIAFGNTIRAKDVGRDIGAALKSLVGGELHSYPTSSPKRVRRQLTGWLETQNSSGQMQS